MRKISYLIVLIAAIVLIVSAQLDWTEDGTNPIFGEGAGGPKAYYPSVLYDADKFSGPGVPTTKYKMWYGTSGSQTGLATSDDGIIWEDQGVVMAYGYHATVEYYEGGFAGDDNGVNPAGTTMYYRMWYWDPFYLYSINAIGYAESPNGFNWFNRQPCQNGAVPIVSGVASWNRGSYGPSDVLYNPAASNSGTDWTFTMYYDGTTGGDEALGLGFSSDGITWTGYDANSDGKADPVLAGTYVTGDWDYNYVSRATIIKNADNDYEMWYSGGHGAMNHGIGYATSQDGMNWTRDVNNPIFQKSDGNGWRDSRTYTPMVIKDGCSYKMWFTGKDVVAGDYSIGYATASGVCVVDVNIDIKPGSDPNCFNIDGHGVIPVAIFGSDDFDVLDIDVATMSFEGMGVRVRGKDRPMCSIEYSNGDSFPDLVCHFEDDSTTWNGGTSTATVTGNLLDGTGFEGTDSICIIEKIIPCDLLGDWLLSYLQLPPGSGTYNHDMTISTQSPDGSFSGTGGYPSGPMWTWKVAGTITDSTVSMTITYDQTVGGTYPYIVLLTGTVEACGSSMSGTAEDNRGYFYTWTATHK